MREMKPQSYTEGSSVVYRGYLSHILRQSLSYSEFASLLTAYNQIIKINIKLYKDNKITGHSTY